MKPTVLIVHPNPDFNSLLACMADSMNLHSITTDSLSAAQDLVDEIKDEQKIILLGDFIEWTKGGKHQELLWAKYLREKGENCPILFLSCDQRHGHQRRVLNNVSGANFLLGPFSLNSVAKHVEAAMEGPTSVSKFDEHDDEYDKVFETAYQ